jgi:hypothetical protein
MDGTRKIRLAVAVSHILDQGPVPEIQIQSSLKHAAGWDRNGPEQRQTRVQAE